MYLLDLPLLLLLIIIMTKVIIIMLKMLDLLLLRTEGISEERARPLAI